MKSIVAEARYIFPDLPDINEVFRCLAGSYLYNLNTEKSDRDYKVFVSDALPKKKLFLSKSLDLDIRPLTELPELLFLPDINFWAMLFTPELITDSKAVKELFELRDEITRMDLPGLYKTTLDKLNVKIGRLKNPVISELAEFKKLDYFNKFGYDTKEAMHAYRLLDLLERFHSTDFTNFKGSLRYEGEEKEFLLGITKGSLSLEEFLALYTAKEEKVKSLERDFNNRRVDFSIKRKVERIIQDVFTECRN